MTIETNFRLKVAFALCLPDGSKYVKLTTSYRWRLRCCDANDTWSAQCQSCVRTTTLKCLACSSRTLFMTGIISSPPLTDRLPFPVKQFWTSMIRRARLLPDPEAGEQLLTHRHKTTRSVPRLYVCWKLLLLSQLNMAPRRYQILTNDNTYIIRCTDS